MTPRGARAVPGEGGARRQRPPSPGAPRTARFPPSAGAGPRPPRRAVTGRRDGSARSRGPGPKGGAAAPPAAGFADSPLAERSTRPHCGKALGDASHRFRPPSGPGAATAPALRLRPAAGPPTRAPRGAGSLTPPAAGFPGRPHVGSDRPVHAVRRAPAPRPTRRHRPAGKERPSAERGGRAVGRLVPRPASHRCASAPSAGRTVAARGGSAPRRAPPPGRPSRPGPPRPVPWRTRPPVPDSPLPISP